MGRLGQRVGSDVSVSHGLVVDAGRVECDDGIGLGSVRLDDNAVGTLSAVAAGNESLFRDFRRNGSATRGVNARKRNVGRGVRVVDKRWAGERDVDKGLVVACHVSDARVDGLRDSLVGARGRVGSGVLHALRLEGRRGGACRWRRCLAVGVMSHGDDDGVWVVVELQERQARVVCFECGLWMFVSLWLCNDE